MRVGQVWRAKPGRAEDYRRFHARVPEVVEQLFRDSGVRNYTLFAWGDVFFAYLEVDDYDAMIERYNRHPDAQRFEMQAGELIEFESDPATGWPLQLAEVWSLQERKVESSE